MEALNEKNIKEMNVLSLSFIGDAVHTLFIREKVLRSANLLAGDYHSKCVKFCNAGSQAYVLDAIYDELSEEEKEVARRARNAKSHKAKNASIENYKKATALEAVIGYNYLINNQLRVNELLELSYQVCKGDKC